MALVVRFLFQVCTSFLMSAVVGSLCCKREILACEYSNLGVLRVYLLGLKILNTPGEVAGNPRLQTFNFTQISIIAQPITTKIMAGFNVTVGTRITAVTWRPVV